MCGGDTTAAVGASPSFGGHAEAFEPRPELPGAQEMTGRQDVGQGGGAECPGDVASDRVDRLVFARVAFAGSGIEQQSGACDVLGVGRGEQLMMTRRGDEVAIPRGRIDVRHLATGDDPSGVPAIEHLDVVVAEVAQQPPGPRGGRGIGEVVAHHWGVGAHAAAPHRGLEVRRARQRVPAVAVR